MKFKKEWLPITKEWQKVMIEMIAEATEQGESTIVMSVTVNGFECEKVEIRKITEEENENQS